MHFRNPKTVGDFVERSGTKIHTMEKDIEIDELRLHYSDTGPTDGIPVLIMHGWGCDHTTVRSVASMLDKEMRVISVDLPGHGQSQEPPEVWGVEKFTTLMEKFINALGIAWPVLVGHSFGGRIAILMASRRPVEKIVLVDAAGIKPRRSLKYYTKVYSFKAARHTLPLLLGKKLGEKMVEKLRKNRGSADYSSSTPMMRAVMSRCVNEDLKEVMPSIKADTLLLWGENDTATPLSDAQTMERLIPSARLVSFPACGHYSFLDNPFGFKNALREFLKDLFPKKGIRLDETDKQ